MQMMGMSPIKMKPNYRTEIVQAPSIEYIVYRVHSVALGA